MKPDLKFREAFKAMRDLGISEEDAKPVLNNLLELYDGKWELIEEENYRALADAIFENAEEKQKADEVKNGSAPPPRSPHLDVQTEKSLSNKRKGISSDLPVEVTNRSSRRVSAASYPSYARDRAAVGREASRTGTSERSIYMEKEANCVKSMNSGNLVEDQPSTQKKGPRRKIKDITNGTEKMEIPVLDEFGSGETLAKFTYINESIAHQNAYVIRSLARISDDDCCSRCSRDCLSYISCECAHETGGVFAYTSEGVLREEFLDKSISMDTNPQKDDYFYCTATTCPLERTKNEKRPEPCKGHLMRKFIKECWKKCGCHMSCGNRVVQRGISAQLQVFVTKDGKGWGLRTRRALPKGAFVCEYVGEILTNTELYERNMQSTQKGRHTYPVYLDADWGAERVLKDDDALCLDATNYGNVARFINHRCYDANLIDIPVQIETPDHHYYHVAFFTKRDVAANEELTWDYKIDFMDHNHPVEAFSCFCGYEFCRDPNAKSPIQVHKDD